MKLKLELSFGTLAIPVDEKVKLVEPEESAQKEDTILGYLSEEEKQLFSLGFHKAHELRKQAETDDDATPEMEMKMSEAKLMSEFLWNSIRNRLKVWDKDIGIRKPDYVVIAIEEKEEKEDDFAAHLRQMLAETVKNIEEIEEDPGQDGDTIHFSLN